MAIDSLSSIYIGTKFWKCPSRKIYAIPQPADITKRKKKSTFSDTSSESEGESVTSAHKKRRSSRHEKTLESITDEMKSLRQQLHEVSKSVEEISKAIKEITSISKSMTIPLSLGKLLRDTFRCTICLKQPMHPPIVVAKCCNILLGCATCVNQWYGGSDGLDKGCPHCREPRGYASTGQFKGLDEFLQAIQNIFDGGESEDSVEF
ncbi:hypothetical protein AC249_AIPGENE366 [Exaiptasia diaphana]|nr:hypothetical protein AC249_AIPGENE366 [Exaiptasia diaphana]